MDWARIAEILKPAGGAGERGRRERVRSGFWRTLKRAARHVPFLDELVAAYFCALDERTPASVRATLLAALAYFVMPLDMVPDVMAGIGFTDDVAVLAAALAAVREHITPAHRLAARRALGKRVES